MAHAWEEPFLSGSRGSGTVFFSGCHLGCCFCQNEAISHRRQGTVLSQAELVAAMLDLAAQGVHNFNLVTASHYAAGLPSLIRDLRRQGCRLPIVWNSGGYESAATLRLLDGLIDVYLPDVKFADADLARRLAGADDYLAVTLAAVREMLRQQPCLVWEDQGPDGGAGSSGQQPLLRRGVVLRHLVLPGHHRDSLAVLDALVATVPLDTPLSLMCQYTPIPALQSGLGDQPELRRRLTTFEYEKVTEQALRLGFTRILGQDRSAATTAFIPAFSRQDGPLLLPHPDQPPTAGRRER